MRAGGPFRPRQPVCERVDRLIAAVAIQADVAVLQADADVEVLARHTPLRLDRST